MALDYQGGYQPNVSIQNGTWIVWLWLVCAYDIANLWLNNFPCAVCVPFLCSQMHFEVIGNSVSDVTGGLGVLIDGNPANMSLSHGHVVRDNTVQGHRSPPTQFSNFDGAITVGVDASSPTCGCRLAKPGPTKGQCCFGSVKSAITSVVVEGNHVLVNPKNGTCAQNGIRIFADNTVARGNTCEETVVETVARSALD